MDAKKIAQNVVALVFVVIISGFLIMFFERLAFEGTPLAIDWKQIWVGLEGGSLQYGTGIRNPPWSILPILPLGLLSLGSSWGLLVLLTLAVLVVSVPPTSNRKIRWMSVLLLALSFPSLRHIVDGNLEGLVIVGILMILSSFRSNNPWVLAGGVLLATSKLQEIWLLLFALGYYVIRIWPVRRWIISVLVMVVFVIPTMFWRGRDWITAIVGIPHRGTQLDTSLATVAGRLELPSWLIVSLWFGMLALTIFVILKTSCNISRLKAGMLISASLLLAPYSAGNNFLTVLAIGVIPLLQFNWIVGLILIALTNLPFLVITDSSIQYTWGSYYWSAISVLTWGVLAWQVALEESGQKAG